VHAPWWWAGSTTTGALQTETVNACIRFLPTLDGQAVFTVEDLSPPAGPLHPVQQAMVDCHGSQCGFCTPGFVMSLWACHRQRHDAAGTRPTRQQLADDLAGNLCRCTGYRPILDAGERMFELPARRWTRPRWWPRCRRWPPTRRWPTATPTGPRARWPTSPRCVPRGPRRVCWPAPPTSACGSTSSCANCRS
jgi:aerobic-type carbon monoxide dehydrogenase small subunit (CoxS/CutS family)